jgi:hypothetical protein
MPELSSCYSDKFRVREIVGNVTASVVEVVYLRFCYLIAVVRHFVHIYVLQFNLGGRVEVVQN